MDDFLEAYFGESDGEEFVGVKLDLAPKENINIDDGFKVFKVLDNGQKEDY